MTQTRTQGYSPVDNNTFNVLKVLTTKLEALQIYETYEQDADERTRGIFKELTQQDRQAAERLLETLRQTIR